MSEEKRIILQNDINESKFATKSSPIAIILCVFAGFFGAHRFYTGYYFIGLFQLLTCGGFLIWFVVDMIQLFRNKFEDAKGNSLINYNERNKLATGLCSFSTILAICWACFYVNWVGNSISNVVDISKIPFVGVKKALNPEFAKETPNEKPDTKKEEIVIEKGGVKITRDNPCIDGKGHNMICGTIVNTMEEPAKNVIIKIELFDKDKNFIAFTEAKIYNLEAKTEFDFQAPIFYKTVSDYKIIKISSD